MKREITIGLAVVAGAALFEAALVPGIILGGAALLTPRLLKGQRGGSGHQTAKRAQADTSLPSPSREMATKQLPASMVKSQLGRTIAKTITFRVVVTTLDFTTNYIVIGEIATAAGLSTFNLIAGPLFYFAHEAVWNHLGPADASAGVRLQLPSANRDGEARQLTVSPALAKTITYRTIATIVDFTTNYVVVGSVAEAAILSSAGFLLGPFVYFGHEKAWEYFAGEPTTTVRFAEDIKLLPAPG